MDYFASELQQKTGAVTWWRKEVAYKEVNVDIARWVLDEEGHFYR